MKVGPEAHRRAPSLDWLRAGAAGLVLLSHARALLFQDAAGAPGLSWAAAAFFGISGLGHQAVMVFFVLSGLLVTDAMLRLAAAGRWSLAGFATARLARLWIVLAPCLVLGALLDRFGLLLVGPAQPYGIPPLGHAALAPVLDPHVLLGNLIFLQTIAVPVLGSNGPLWSLANEAWYYLLAGLAFAAWQARGSLGRALPPLIAAVGIGALLPSAILQLAPVWACGAAVALLRHHRPRVLVAQRRLVGGLGAVLIVLVLPASRLRWGVSPLAADLALGVAVAALLLAVPASRRDAPRRGAVVARRLADASYSLYLSHVPVLAFLAAVTVGPRRLPVGLPAFLLLAVALLGAGAVGCAIWWAFERQTRRLQAWLARRSFNVPLPAYPREVAP